MMVSHLILVLGLLCAGAVADLASWDYAEDSAEPRSSETYWTGFLAVRNNCNECLRTVTEIAKRVQEAKKIGTFTKDFYPCQYLTSRQRDICRNVMVFVREEIATNYMDHRGICAKAKYCIMKYNSYSSPSRTLILPSSNNGDWSGQQGELDGSRCKARKNEDKLESAGLAEKEPSLDLAKPDAKCRECKAIIRDIRKYIGDNTPQPYMLPYSCGGLKDSKKDHCFDMIGQNGDDIMLYLLAKKPSNEICTAIEECRQVTNAFCKACQKYIYYGNLMGYNSDPWEGWACSDFKGTDRAQCKAVLRSRKAQIMKLLDQNQRATAEEVCLDVELCAPMLLMSRQLH